MGKHSSTKKSSKASFKLFLFPVIMEQVIQTSYPSEGNLKIYVNYFKIKLSLKHEGNSKILNN